MSQENKYKGSGMQVKDVMDAFDEAALKLIHEQKYFGHKLATEVDGQIMIMTAAELEAVRERNIALRQAEKEQD